MKEAESIRDTVIGKGQVKNACLLKCTLSPLRHRSLRNYRWLCTERYTFYYPVYLYRRVPLENGTTVILSIYIIMYICILLFIYIYIYLLYVYSSSCLKVGGDIRVSMSYDLERQRL